ncbi:unnamed protein product, partial [marine sediment metagenome]
MNHRLKHFRIMLFLAVVLSSEVWSRQDTLSYSHIMNQD